MSAEPDLSVVVAAYNAAGTIGATLRSLLSQTLESIEVLVIDDGSVDETATIVEEQRSIDPRVRLISLDVNQGRSVARNRGLAEARGRWIGACDADDLWGARRAEVLIGAAERRRVDIVTDDQMGFTRLPDGAIVLNHRYASRSTILMGREHCIRRRGWFFDVTCSMRPIVRAEFLRRCGADFPVQLANGEDLSFYLQLVFDPSAPCVLRVGEPSYYYREGMSTRVSEGWSDTHTLLTSYAVEQTGSRELDRWARRAAPAHRYVGVRFRNRLHRHGRLDWDGDDLAVIQADVSAVRGWGLLIRRYVLKVVSRVLDWPYRDAVARDIAAQLDSTR
jgi:glycosyltransferase involved in cell wall biosynthesis